MLIPGLGADARQFEAQRTVFPQLRVPVWIEPRGGERLREYAVRLGASAGVTSESVVGGSSFGGMVALEIARAFRCRAAVLMGSCRSRDCVSPILRVIEWFNPVLPRALVGAATPQGLKMLPLFDPVRGEHARLLGAMAKGIDPAFLKWGGRSVFAWEGCAEPGVPVYHVHGLRDRFIPASRVKADVVVEGHGHFLNLTAPAEVNAFLSRAVRG